MDLQPKVSVVQARYVQALAGEDAFTSFKKAPKRMTKLLKGLSKRELSRAPAAGGWSILQVLAHLADGEFVLGARMRMAAAHDTPPIQPYDENLFATRLGVENARVDELLESFAATRKANVRFLERLPDGARARAGLHAERGLESIETMLAIYAGHDRIHEAQIERVKAEVASKRRAKR